MTQQMKRIKQFFGRQTVANRLEAEWVRQGAIAAQMGLSPDSLSNRAQRAGYRAMVAVRRELQVQFSGENRQ